MAQIEQADPSPAPVAAQPEGNDARHKRQQRPRRQHDANEPLPEFDEAKLVKLKGGKVVAPLKPDTTERDLSLEKMQVEVKRLGERIAEIKAIKESNRKASRSAPLSPEALEHKQKKQAFAAQWATELKQKQRVREEFQRANTEREVLRSDLREARGKMPRGAKPDRLEADIEQLEYKMQHETLTPADEKSAHARVAALTAARPVAKQIATMEERLKVVDGLRADAKKRLSECDELLEAIKAKEKEEGAALEELRKPRDAQPEVDIAALDVEKQECWDIMQALRQKSAEVRAEFDARWKVWADLNKHYSAWKRHEQYKQYLERQAAREERQAREQQEQEGEGEGQVEATEGAPAAGARAENRGRGAAAAGKGAAAAPQADAFDAELFRVDQLLTYLRKFQATSDQGPASGESKAVEVPQGLKPFARKDEDMSFFTAVERKGRGGGRVGSAKADAKGSTPVESKRKLNHNLDILQSLMALGVEVPHSAAELSGAAAKVEAKRAELVEKRKQGKQAPASQVLQANMEMGGAPAPAKSSSSASKGDGVGVCLSVDETGLLSVQLDVEGC